MSDNGNLESLSEVVAGLYQAGDRKRLLIGVLLARAEKRYGAGVVNAVASNTGISRQSLYEYQKVERFYRGAGKSARRIIVELPNLFYSHLRTAMRFKDWEAAYDALVDASTDNLTADGFRVKVAKAMGTEVPPMPLLKVEGPFWQVMSLAAEQMQGRADLRVELVLRKVA
jgi:hypothetical protein